MMTRQLFSICLLVLFPTFCWAIDEAPIVQPTEKSILTDVAPVKPALPTISNPTLAPAAEEIPAPALHNTIKPVSTADGAAKTIPAHSTIVTTPAKIAPASSPALAAPIKPQPIKPILVKPITAEKPIAAKPATVIAAPAKAPPTSGKPALSSPIITRPAATQTKPIPQTVQTHTVSSSVGESIDIEFFVREGCPQCDIAKAFLTKLQKLQPELKISIRDVRKEPAALELLKRMAQNHDDIALDYPAFVIGGQLIIGFSDEANSAQNILDILAVTHPPRDQTNQDTENCITGKDLSCGLITVTPPVQEEAMSFTILGRNVSLLQIGLPIFTLAMGLLDGLNHGSTWALILMISLLSPMNNRPLMLAIAGTFILVQGILYFLLMAVWLNLNLLIDISFITNIIFAGIAVLIGSMYLIQYIYFGEKLAITSHEISKPGIYTRIRKIVETESLWVILFSTATLAVIVQLGEFTFSSVFPLLYTKILSLQHFTAISNYSYLLLYDFAYMLDDIIVLTIGVVTLSQARAETVEWRSLKLISGLLLMALAGYIFSA